MPEAKLKPREAMVAIKALASSIFQDEHDLVVTLSLIRAACDLALVGTRYAAPAQKGEGE